jgi:hypothetical protein
MKIVTNTYGVYGVTLQQARQYLRISDDATDEDTLISALVSASYEQVCAECNRFFVETAVTMSVASASGDIFVTAADVTNLSTGSRHQWGDSGITYAFFDQYYSGPISYTVASGSTTVPAGVAAAQIMLVSQWYENRQPQVIGASATKLDFSVEALLSPYKIVTPGFDPPRHNNPFSSEYGWMNSPLCNWP